MELLYWIILGGLAALSAVLAWFALQKTRPLVAPVAADRRGFLVLAARRGLTADLDGPPATWRLTGHLGGRAVRVAVVEVEGERWTEARLSVRCDPALRVSSRAQGSHGAVPVGHPVADQVLAAWGPVAGLAELWADEARLAAWLELLGPEDGAAVEDGWLVHAVEGAEGEAVAALVDRLADGARRMGL